MMQKKHLSLKTCGGGKRTYGERERGSSKGRNSRTEKNFDEKKRRLNHELGTKAEDSHLNCKGT